MHTYLSRAPRHAISKQVNQHYLPLLFTHTEGKNHQNTTEQEISERNRFFSVDGMGMAWYTATRSLFSSMNEHSVDCAEASTKPVLKPAMFKITKPCAHDANFQHITANTSSTCVLAHIRAASMGVIAEVNNHPYVFGRHTIMHNGYISDYHSIARQMAGLMSNEAYSSITGRTDSEALAALYMTYLTAGSHKASGRNKFEVDYTTSEMFTALQNTVNTIIELQKTALGDNHKPNDLNVCVTSGRNLVACRFRNHVMEQPPTLYWSKTAGVTLNRKFPDHPDGSQGFGKAHFGVEGTHGQAVEGHNPYWDQKRQGAEHGKHVIVASEPTTYRECEWGLIEKNTAIVVNAQGEEHFESLIYGELGG